jgi:hypothetical protein
MYTSAPMGLELIWSEAFPHVVLGMGPGCGVVFAFTVLVFAPVFAPVVEPDDPAVGEVSDGAIQPAILHEARSAKIIKIMKILFVRPIIGLFVLGYISFFSPFLREDTKFFHAFMIRLLSTLSTAPDFSDETWASIFHK